MKNGITAIYKEFRTDESSDVYIHHICVGSIIKHPSFWLLTCNFYYNSHIPAVSSVYPEFKFETRDLALQKLYELLNMNKDQIEIVIIEKTDD